jgi:RNA polymerase sigma-70 factor (ECF subfamily)
MTRKRPPRVAAREEGTLLERIARGDADALRLLYERLAPRVFALCVRILGDPAAAAEVLRQTFLEVWRRASEDEGWSASPAAWIASMARARALSSARSAAAGEARRRPPKSTLSALPPTERIALELAYFEGLTHREIAERTGASPSAVRARVRRGMERLGALEG